MNVALVIDVGFARRKSSLVSISKGAVSGREAAAMSPSGFPVLKKNGAAVATGASARARITDEPFRESDDVHVILHVSEKHTNA